MSAEELKAVLSTPAALFGLMLLASLGSAWKQMLVARRGGNFVSVQSYFLDNWPETLAMIGHNVIAFVMLIFTDTLNPAAAIGLGYIANDAADAYTKEGRSFSMGPNDPYAASGNQKGFARPLMLAILLAIAVPTVMLLPGCVTNQVQQLSFDQRWKLANDTHALATQTVTSALDARLISSKDARAYLGLAVSAKDVLDAAWSLRTADISTAEGQLQLANDILIRLQQFLIERGSEK